jgi:hypothetical protein
MTTSYVCYKAFQLHELTYLLEVDKYQHDFQEMKHYQMVNELLPEIRPKIHGEGDVHVTLSDQGPVVQNKFCH